jgi:integrase
MVKKALAKKEGKLKTFSKVYYKVKTKAMTQIQWIIFLEELTKINSRDALVAKIILQGAKRVNEVLTLQTDQINWKENQIVFQQSKMGMALLRNRPLNSSNFLIQNSLF